MSQPPISGEGFLRVVSHYKKAAKDIYKSQPPISGEGFLLYHCREAVYILE